MWMFIAKMLIMVLISLQLVIINDNLVKIQKEVKEKEKEKIETVTNIQTEYVIIGDGIKWDVKIPKGDKK